MTALLLIVIGLAAGVLASALGVGGGVVFVPATIVGMLPGLWIGHRISKPKLRTVSVVILAAIALYAILAP